MSRNFSPFCVTHYYIREYCLKWTWFLICGLSVSWSVCREQSKLNWSSTTTYFGMKLLETIHQLVKLRDLNWNIIILRPPVRGRVRIMASAMEITIVSALATMDNTVDKVIFIPSLLILLNDLDSLSRMRGRNMGIQL